MAKKTSKRSVRNAEPPMASCLLLCDDVLHSVGRGKHTLVGVVDSLSLPSVPAVVGPFVIYFKLSNVYSRQAVKLSIVEEDGTDVVRVSTTSPAEYDPLSGHTLIIPLPQFAIKSAGRHRLVASHDEVPFAQSPVFVTVLREETHDVDDTDNE